MAEFCTLVGTGLAKLDHDLLLLTGGVAGVPELIGHAFWTGRGRTADCVVHLLPDGFPAPVFGRTLRVAGDMHDRREILARAAKVYIAVDGRAGTSHEASVAIESGAALIAAGGFGGISATLAMQLPRPPSVPAAIWRRVQRSTEPQDAASAVCAAADILLEPAAPG